MRKSRFLLNLIAATAIGLSAVGCQTGDSGAIEDTTDLIQSAGNSGNGQLFEYLLIGQRGLEALSPEFSDSQGNPTLVGSATNNRIFTGPADEGLDNAPPQLFEVFGVGHTPTPDAKLRTPGDGSSTAPVTPDDEAVNGADTGFQEVYPSPGGEYAIGVSRGRGRPASATDTVTNAQVKVFKISVTPIDVAFPPQLKLGNPIDPVNEFLFPPDQGEFVSGAWGSSGQQFYVGIDGSIQTVAFNGINGRSDFVQRVSFPVAPAGLNINNLGRINNPVKIIAAPNNQVIYALDNANSQLVTYRRNQADGTLTQVGTTAVPADPRGMALDRSGQYLYVAGRGSEQLAGFKVSADGTVAAIDVFPALGLGAIPFNVGDPLGDVAASPRVDALFLSTYLGVMQAYSIDPATGGLSASGTGARPLAAPTGSTRNAANIEVDPTGRFVFAAYEHDLDSFQSYNNPANGFPYDEGAVFTNADSNSNDVAAGGTALSPTPQLDETGRIIFTAPLPDGRTFEGNVQTWRIEDTGQVRAESLTATRNPFGLQFFQKVFQAPQAEPGTPVQP